MKMKESKSYGIDVNALIGPRDPRPLGDVIKAHRIRICDLVIDDLRQFPQTRRHPITGKIIVNAHGTWNRIRGVLVDDVRTVDDVLRRPEIQGSVTALEKVIDVLLRAHEQRRELEEKLHQLDSIAQAFSQQQELAAK